MGLTVSSYSDTQIVLTPGSLYSSYGFYPGDSFTMVVLGSSYSGTVSYPPSNHLGRPVHRALRRHQGGRHHGHQSPTRTR